MLKIAFFQSCLHCYGFTYDLIWNKLANKLSHPLKLVLHSLLPSYIFPYFDILIFLTSYMYFKLYMRYLSWTQHTPHDTPLNVVLHSVCKLIHRQQEVWLKHADLYNSSIWYVLYFLALTVRPSVQPNVPVCYRLRVSVENIRVRFAVGCKIFFWGTCIQTKADTCCCPEIQSHEFVRPSVNAYLQILH